MKRETSKVWNTSTFCCRDYLKFSFQPVFHDWYNKGRGMYYPVYGLLIGKTPARSYLNYFRPTKFKTRYVALQLFIFRRTVQIAPNFLHEMRTYFSFALILRDIPNSITPQNTLRLLLIPVPRLLPPPPPHCFCPGQRNQRRPVPVPVTGVRYNSFL